VNKQTKLIEPWRSIHGAVWLIGLAILFWKGWWWPGILVLIAISGVVEAVFRSTIPGAVTEIEPDSLPQGDAVSDISSSAPESVKPVAQTTVDANVAANGVHRSDLLPSTCPTCGAPVSGDAVRWTGPRSADCPYCGANLPMQKE
jgi:hypothetical protein